MTNWLNRREEFETEALIFLTEREAEHAYLYIEKRLKESRPWKQKIQLCYMNRDSQNFRKGLTVTTFYIAKRTGIRSGIRSLQGY